MIKLPGEYQLWQEVRRDHATNVVTIVTITGTFEGGLEEQAELMNKMASHVDVIVIITNQIGSMSDVSSRWHHMILLVFICRAIMYGWIM